MKFDCGETLKEKKLRLNAWHTWYAWRPVQVENHDCRWLEFVERRCHFDDPFDGSWWEYRKLTNV